MVKINIGNIHLDPELFDLMEAERKKINMPRATYINQKLREIHNL